ncbi:hypothetical protein L282_0185 [Escherichia coli APEC IMT5155]|nr:hypothetical protein L282_0185 [Escherichia coli APEC IMT5155]ESA68184.1 hypothetical protein HMPREF1588_03963 [Escherichia coli 110957]ESD40025.1 hypothetical protein HMPREF1602_03214 [Escherichia coli 907889]EYE02776.1 hypothetical protein AC80_2656 [Escherichia coli 1-110-08_S4_C1]KEJ12818.1 hypothetical protein AB50_2396 [Escherichia coli 6-175-07_S1_C2]
MRSGIIPTATMKYEQAKQLSELGPAAQKILLFASQERRAVD